MYHFINDSVQIDFPLPKAIQEIVEEAEDADKREQFMEYIDCADMIDVMCKNACAGGDMSIHQWDVVTARYTQS